MSFASVTNRDFESAVLREEAPVLVAFRASWCVPSIQMEEILDEVAVKYRDRAKVVGVDVGDDVRAHRLCMRYDVTRLPVVALFHEGERRDWVGGMTSSEVIAEMLETRLKPVLEVGERDFDAEVLRSRVPVLAFFRAGWCAASIEVESVVQAVAQRFAGRAKVVSVDFDDNARVCARYGIVRVPTLALFDGGEIRDQIVGAMVGGTKVEGERATSCVGLTASQNVEQMLEAFVL